MQSEIGSTTHKFRELSLLTLRLVILHSGVPRVILNVVQVTNSAKMTLAPAICLRLALRWHFRLVHIGGATTHCLVEIGLQFLLLDQGGCRSRIALSHFCR